MKKIGKNIAVAAVVVILLTLCFATVALAADGVKGAGYGETSDGTGPDLQNQWGNNAGAGGGMQSGYGESSDGAGPGLQNQWGK